MTTNHDLPIIEELIPAPDLMAVVQRFATWPSLIVLDSTLCRDPVGRYSFLMADPLQSWEVQSVERNDDPLLPLREALEPFHCHSVPNLPPFQGGIAGLLSYELGRCWENVPKAKYDEFELPVLATGLFDWVLTWDHRLHR
ncbi:MAG: aminodeoxychorismate synthase, component I, partial [Planctomycetes bacterium]|nr:aminodeoxychorismate synthase, component I [Planctomycetota bacterium]